MSLWNIDQNRDSLIDFIYDVSLSEEPIIKWPVVKKATVRQQMKEIVWRFKEAYDVLIGKARAYYD